jgi:predicted kinase
MVIMVIGLPGSGKSFFARRLSKLLDAVYINSDETRKSFIITPCYSAAEKELVYDKMLQETLIAIQKNEDVVLDATFYLSAIREKFKRSISHLTDLFYIEITAREDLVKKRLENERQDSDADFTIYKLIRRNWEPLKEEHLTMQSTDDEINILLLKAYHYVQRRQNAENST